MHSCSGITDNTRTWAGRLVGWGYAALIVDSFRPRNVNEVCSSTSTMSNPRPILRAQDAFNAAIYLRTLSIIQPDHIGVIGFSHGGSTALYAALASGVPTDRGGRPFQAVVAYYPGCLRKVRGEPEKILGEPASDVLILIGTDDDWTPAADCLKYVELQSGFPHAPAPTIKVYPGALHSFDLAGLPMLSSSGHMIGRNPEAAADSFVMTKAFLDARLKVK
jgi:dienelactone hydrolase